MYNNEQTEYDVSINQSISIFYSGLSSKNYCQVHWSRLSMSRKVS